MISLKHKLAVGLSLVSSILLDGGSLVHAAEFARLSVADHACEPDESWKFDVLIPKEVAKEFSDDLSDSINPYESFVKAVKLRNAAQNVAMKSLAEYWIAHSLYDAKQMHLAEIAFTNLFSRFTDKKELGIQVATLGCLVKIHEKYPSFKWDLPVLQKMAKIQTQYLPGPQKAVVWNAALMAMRDHVSRSDIETVAPILFGILKGGGVYESYAKALYSQKKNDYAAAVLEMRKVIDAKSRPEVIQREFDLVLLMHARSLYTLRKYEEAAEYFRKVPKDSNYLTQALSDLSWSFLMRNNYREAIGTSYNLQKSLLSRVFVPEGPMVMAIALNEVCQFPQAIQAVAYFRKRYRAPYKWLYDWQAKPESIDLYQTLVKHLKGEKNVPDPIATEWLRSPVFIAGQEEINLLKDEKNVMPKLVKLSFADQKQSKNRAVEVQKIAKELQVATGKDPKAKGPKKVDASRKEEINKLRQQLAEYQARSQASVLWDSMLRGFHPKIPAMDQTMVRVVNEELARLNKRMIKQLLQVAENTELIEIEIFDGASEDMVWRNANSDYAEISKKFKDDAKKNNKAVWEWGSMNFQDDNGEIWEDELGWFSGDITDECSNKNKYVQIKAKQ